VKESLFIVGGTNASGIGGYDLSQMFAVNCVTLTSVEIKLTGRLPAQALMGHCAIPYHGELVVGSRTSTGVGILIFGGRYDSRKHDDNNRVYSIDTRDGKWDTIKEDGMAPQSRTDHIMLDLGQYCLVYGGNDTFPGYGHADAELHMLAYRPTKVHEEEEGNDEGQPIYEGTDL
jgi:hypothetical protein